MSNSSPSITLKAKEDQVVDGINSIINMIELIGQPFFPRNVMTASYNGFFPVNDLKQMYHVFERSNFQNCRISAYPPVTDQRRLIPNLLLLDIDYEDTQVRKNGKDYADKLNKTKVNKILKRLEKFEIRNVMIMKTGNGRHILIPFMFDTPFEEIQEMHHLLDYLISRNPRRVNNVISENFLPFAKKFLSKNQADQGNYPTFSSVFLRVPGTINMKMKYGDPEIVKIERELEYDKTTIPGFGDLYPDTKLIFEFMHHMHIVAGNQYYRKQFKPRLVHAGSVYKSIEYLHNTAISDCRKRALWLILASYAINIRHMSSENAFIWIKKWADKCNEAYPFEKGYNIDQQIDYYISRAEGDGHYPISFDNWNTDDWRMKTEGNITLFEFVWSKMGPESVLYDANKGGYQKV